MSKLCKDIEVPCFKEMKPMRKIELLLPLSLLYFNFHDIILNACKNILSMGFKFELKRSKIYEQIPLRKHHIEIFSLSKVASVKNPLQQEIKSCRVIATFG